MILGFYKYINGIPTHFKERILACVGINDVVVQTVKTPYGQEFIVPKTHRPKKHTIREDKHNRWRRYMSIQMVYRGKNYKIEEHFNKNIYGLQVVESIQTITIQWRRPTWMMKDYGSNANFPPFTLMKGNQFLFVYIDGKLIGGKTLRELALNDGFDSITAFLKYFRKSIKNWKIIHFTDFKYGQQTTYS